MLPTSKFRRVLHDPDRLAELPHRQVYFADPYDPVSRTPADTQLDGKYHEAKRGASNRMVLAYMETNQTKNETRRERPWKYDQKRVGLTVFGRSEGIYNATNNPFVSNSVKNDYVDSAIVGGVLETPEGQVFRSKKLQQRVVNLNTRDAVAQPLSETIPTNSKLSDVTVTPSNAIMALEEAINNYYTLVATSNYNAEAVSVTNNLYNTLQKYGFDYTRRELMDALNVIESSLANIFNVMNLPSAGPTGLSIDRFRIAETVLIISLRIRVLTKSLITTSDLNKKERKLALSEQVKNSRNVNVAETALGRADKVQFYDDVLNEIVRGGVAPDCSESEDEDVYGGGNEELPEVEVKKKSPTKSKVKKSEKKKFYKVEQNQ
jgi:hypothetical protein